MKKKRIKFKELCSIEGCEKRARHRHECLTCEKLKKPDPFVLFACRGHYYDTLEQIRKHALVKHPTNMLGAIGAALKGEDIF